MLQEKKREGKASSSLFHSFSLERILEYVSHPAMNFSTIGNLSFGDRVRDSQVLANPLPPPARRTENGEIIDLEAREGRKEGRPPLFPPVINSPLPSFAGGLGADSIGV